MESDKTMDNLYIRISITSLMSSVASCVASLFECLYSGLCYDLILVDHKHISCSGDVDIKQSHNVMQVLFMSMRLSQSTFLWDIQHIGILSKMECFLIDWILLIPQPVVVSLL